jgi:putative DNA primase/helicase
LAPAGATTLIDYQQLDALCGGRLGTRDVPCPLCGPDRRDPANRKRRVLRIWHKEPGFITYTCARCSASGYARDGQRQTYAPAPKPEIRHEPDEQAARNFEFARRLWQETVPLEDTLGWRYFIEQRKIDLRKLCDLSHALRWHAGVSAVVAKMTDAITGKTTGVHRTFLDQNAAKIDRKMIGKQGVIRLTPDEDVTLGLGITEGVEDGLAILPRWSPIWVATSAGAIKRFPVFSGIDSLTIFADADEVGMAAAIACADNWISSGREARISPTGGVI